MDRLNQLRGDAGASRESTLDTSSLLGESYMTANDSSKYFSLSEVDSSNIDSPLKEEEDNVTADNSLSQADSITSSLSPIPNKSELDTFKIGEQIEAANILSGGVNIFDDNENSYDGDELVIDDAVTEDDKPAEIKLDENPEVTFEKSDRLADTSMEDAETAIPSKDTEVVLQIDGKNVDAIDIGNGLYLYRKDGEEELAAVQILDDNQQQPDIKFLKVRENAEGNLEVYEEIEIEVPKEVPSTEGKAVKNTSQNLVKDVTKVNEPICNKVAENNSQSLPKDTVITEVEFDLQKDNAHIESKTEVNLNGKMMKFSESRKSPLIGTFTPMTYHSTPNKEGIPLTKTMVDLQLHPNRHSENVKKTIEVHTDNCKQRLLETPTKGIKDSSDQNRHLELVSPSLDKDLMNYTIIDGVDQTIAVNNKDNNKAGIENNTDDIIAIKIIEDKMVKNDKKLECQETKLVDKNNFEINVKDDKTEISALEKPSVALGAQSESSTNSSNEDDNLKASTSKNSVNQSKENEEISITKPCDEIKDGVRTENAEEKYSKCTESDILKTTDAISSKNDNVVKEKEMENQNISIDKGVNQSKEKNTEVIKKKQNICDAMTSNTIVSHGENSQNPSKITQSISDCSLEKNKHIKLSQNDLENNDINNVKQIDNNPIEAIKIPPKLNPNQEIKQVHKPVEILNCSTLNVKLVTNKEITDSERKGMQTLKDLSDDKKILALDTSEKEMQIKIKPLQEGCAKALKNLESTEPKTESLLPQSDQSLLHNLSKEELKPVPELKKQGNEGKNNLPEAPEIKSNPEQKHLKQPNKIFDINHHLSKNLKIGDINEVIKKSETENKNIADRLPKGLVKKVDTKLDQAEITSSNLISEACKPAPSTVCINLHRDSLTIEQNCDSNALAIMKPSTAEIQKKNAPNQKLPILNKNTKVSLLTLDKLPHTTQNILNVVEQSKNDNKKEPAKVSKVSIPKPINNNKAAVPFGKWTEANRQEFLNKIKESKVPINTSNTKQLKQPNDLNRRDVLQKIDSQRQSNIASTKVQELNMLNKMKLKLETTAFVNKSNVIQKDKLKDNKVSPSISKAEEPVSTENTIKLGKKLSKENPLLLVPVDMSNTTLSTKKDSVHRKEINNQDLIDKTIEGIINRAVTAKLGSEDVKQDVEPPEKPQNVTSHIPVSLDEIESKMNELHGIPFVERPPHELPKVFENENKNVVTADLATASKASKLPSTSSFTNKLQPKNEHTVNQPVITRVNEESDEEIIEHEPVTGDIELNKNIASVHGPVKNKLPTELTTTKVHYDSKKESIITENDFDKFARRNSITYENCLTVNFDGKEHHNVVQTVVEREPVPKKLSRNEIMLAESKAKSHKQLAVRHINFSSKNQNTTKVMQDEDSYTKKHQTKLQLAYQSAMTAKRHQEFPISIIEDKPVKVVFMDGNHEYVPHQLNVQGKELSPPKKTITDWDNFTHSNSESLDSDILDSSNDNKSQDDIKFKTKHQRKQVLTPVEAPELELIEPDDLGIEVSPKKKRKIEDNKSEKNSKSLVPKKSYLLNRNITMDDASSNTQDSTKITSKESVNQQDTFVKHSNPISAIDNLVKAAELLETQSESKQSLTDTDQDSLTQQHSPVKRGRGRPRKYPVSDQGSDKAPSPVKTPTPQKKPRLIDAKIPKPETESEDDEDEINSDGELVKENWTMGKINENIVCPICNKLFRSENVVFKHVKHCTGPSPSRSDSDKRSVRRMRQSQELDWKSEDSKSDSMDIDDDYEINEPMKKRKSKEKRSSFDDEPVYTTDVIVIEDTPIKDRDSPIRKRERFKHEPNKSIVKAKIQHGTSSLVCEFCGKTFRQLSYLVNHRLQHKNTESMNSEKDHVHKSLFSCEICKKEFRKLHHLVQHRIIHNPNPIRSSRKSSSEQNDTKTTKDPIRPMEDQSAGFRCEPCDKSFRKLHHLVEHRETHDEINKKCNPVTSTVNDATKPTPLHHCDVCKKTFKKFQHLIEHKEHHLDTSSEKSDDKSVKSSLSTKDIIHECPLCYMVFPNEHSLNKHHIICQRKKKQSAAKQSKQIDKNDTANVDSENKITEAGDETLAIFEPKADVDTSCVVIVDEPTVVLEKQESKIIEVVKTSEQENESEFHNEIRPTELDLPLKPELDRKTEVNEKHIKSTNKNGYERNVDKDSGKSKKNLISTAAAVEVAKLPDTATPKKKLLTKDKIGTTVTKRQKTTNVPLPVVNDVETHDSSDEDEIRYMLNPDFQIEESKEGKLFMKVRAKKRNSLQIERPNSKDLMKRRISLQHPPKIPRLKAKPVTRKPINTNTVVRSSRSTVVPAEPPAATDSDDSDVKYSFPEPVMKELEKEAQKKVKRQKVIEKRKSLSNIAKRKSLGKMSKQKVNPTPVKQIKKRSVAAEHRCDCGQLFSSAALLTRHTSLAHTPPRIRRRRSPPPDSDAKPILKRTEKPHETRKTIDPVPVKTGVITRKSSSNSEMKAVQEVRKTPKSSTPAKTRRSIPHKGVPVPEKMRKLMDKSKK